MTQTKATARPWSVAVETEAEDGLTITIPEIGRCLHDWEWADAEEWDRDLANADLIVAAVNQRDALLSEVAQLREAVRWMLDSRGAYLFHEDECPWNYGPDDGCNCRVLKAREMAKER